MFYIPTINSIKLDVAWKIANRYLYIARPSNVVPTSENAPPPTIKTFLLRYFKHNIFLKEDWAAGGVLSIDSIVS